MQLQQSGKGINTQAVCTSAGITEPPPQTLAEEKENASGNAAWRMFGQKQKKIVWKKKKEENLKDDDPKQPGDA